MFDMLIPPPASNVRWVYDDPSGLPDVPAQVA